MNNIFQQKGFTLIELMVVISIIGLLASLLLVRVRQSQFDAYDSAIMQTFDTLRTKAEIDRSENGNYSAVCQEVGGTAGNSLLTNSGDYQNINISVKRNNGEVDVVCNEGSQSLSYAAWTPLRAKANTFWCLDYKATLRKLAAQPASDTTECP